MNDPKVRFHMPLLKGEWSVDAAKAFVAAKEDCWEKDGRGHQAFLLRGEYIGWGGFQKEGEEWDLGLVLTPDAFGLGPRIVKRLLMEAREIPEIPYVTFLLPPTRQNRAALHRLGARLAGTVAYEGQPFLKYRLETAA